LKEKQFCFNSPSTPGSGDKTFYNDQQFDIGNQLLASNWKRHEKGGTMNRIDFSYSNIHRPTKSSITI